MWRVNGATGAAKYGRLVFTPETIPPKWDALIRQPPEKAEIFDERARYRSHLG